MNRTILIPSNFELKTLELLKKYLKDNSLNKSKVDILILKGVNLTSSITESLLISRSKLIETYCPPAFNDELEVIKKNFDNKINSIRKDLYIGSSQLAFDEYIKLNNIDFALISSTPLSNNGIEKYYDLSPLIEKSSLPKVSITVQAFNKGEINKFSIKNIITSS